MFRNHLKFIFRNLSRNKVYATFSIISLSIGLVCSILIYLYVTHEVSYDTFFKHSNRIVRLEYVSTSQSGTGQKDAISRSSLFHLNLHSIPEIVERSRMAKLYSLFARSKHTKGKIVVNKGFAADSSFFEVFNFKILEGDKGSPLSQPNSVVLTQKTAGKIFGNENPIGKTFSVYYFQQKIDLRVTAVMENVPANSHFDFNFLMDAATYKTLTGYSLSGITFTWEYLLLSKNANIKAVTRKINHFIPKSDAKYLHYELMPVPDIHLYSHARYEIKSNGSIRTVYFFSLIGGIILLISAINFISLFLSHSAGRGKELGVREVLGANNGQLSGQLLLESTGMAVLSLPIALALGWFCLPWFNSLTGVSFTLHDLLSFSLIWKALIFAVLVGLLSGIYPALFMPKNSYAKWVKSSSTNDVGGGVFQHSIIVFQFAASALLIVGTLVVGHQLTFMQDKDLGFQKKGIITTSNYLGKKLHTFKEMLSGNPGIERISASTYIPGTSESGGTELVKSVGNEDSVTCDWISVDYNFFKTYGLKIDRGRSFSKDFPTDSTKAFIINEAAVKALGLRHPLGTQLRALGKAFKRTGKVVGVVKDFNYLSLHKKIPPMLFLIYPQYYLALSIKLASNKNISATLDDIKKVSHAVQPNVPFEYSFLDQKFNALYENDRKAGNSYLAFSIIAILVSCLGLFSLASHSMQKRTKEIGIRKVLGATVPNILNLFYGKYLKLIVAANALAIPVAWYLLRNWLTNFAFRVQLGVFPFVAAFVITCIFTVLAVSYWALKAAWSNPIDSIRVE